MGVEFNFAARSDIGLLRKNNQDSGYAGPALLVVADGMGGAAGGDIASSVVIAHLAPLDDAPSNAERLLPELNDALQAAHDELVQRANNDKRLRGLGTTCTAILRSENKLAMVHIGDSRAYLLRDEQLVQVTSDHSFVQYLVDTGQITPEEAEVHPKRSVILRVLGDNPGSVAVDETVREAVVGDRWLLCSDGLSGVVSDDTIQEVLKTTPDPEECCEKLVELALLGGGPDNITCVIGDVVRIGEAPVQSPEVVGAAAIDRNAPTKGTMGAAGRAAALASPDPVVDDEDEEDDEPKKRIWPLILALVVGLAIAAGGLFGAWSWSQTQYYIQGSDGKVVVYQGIPQQLGPVQFSHPVEVTDITLSSLTTLDRRRLEEPVVRSSYEDIEEYLDEIVDRAGSSRDLGRSRHPAFDPQSSQSSQSGES